MTITGACKALASELVAQGITYATQRRSAVLAFAHDQGTAPLAGNIAQFLTAVVPGTGLFWSEIHNQMTAKLPEFQTSFAAGLDQRAGVLFDFAMTQGTKLAAYLAK